MIQEAVASEVTPASLLYLAIIICFSTVLYQALHKIIVPARYRFRRRR